MNLVETPSAESIPLRPLNSDTLAPWLELQPETVKRWITATGFKADAGKTCLVPGSDGAIREVLVGIGDASEGMWDFAALPKALPARAFHLDAELSAERANGAALGWALGTYRFDRHEKKDAKQRAVLAWPSGCDRPRVESAARATFLVRDLVNAPASDMGPAELAESARATAEDHGGAVRIVVGDELIELGFPAIHAVGRAASPDRAPRLIDFSWGEPSSPKVTLVGKGVCFDTGGLDLKPSAHMKLMKKDMGGGAHVLGLARMIMSAKLPVRLRVLIPAVENSVSASSLRPLDVVPTRKGTTIEIGNTDAEGRVILADALTEASSETPELIIDFATLTGAARIALGAELPALYSNDDKTAAELLAHGERESDPLWRMPLFKPYRSLIDSKVADLTNATESPLGGSITAALFLQEFLEPEIPWIHIDVMAWNTRSRPGRPEGGEAMGMRAVYALIEERFCR
jgi:leucyl aminopeptidase